MCVGVGVGMCMCMCMSMCVGAWCGRVLCVGRCMGVGVGVGVCVCICACTSCVRPRMWLTALFCRSIESMWCCSTMGPRRVSSRVG